MAFVLVFLIVWWGGIALAWAWYDWRAALAWAIGVLVAFSCGWAALRFDITTDGYVLTKAKDMTGRRRWRVGIPSRPAETDVQWIAPGQAVR